MKLHPIPLAIALAAATAQAHSADTVTVYGVADSGYQYLSIKGQGSSSGLVSGGQAASRWGLKGSHDLGNGYKTNFQLENGFDILNGTASQGGRLFGRAAWVGLSGDIGELRAGRQTLAATDYTGAFSPFGTSFKTAGGGQAINSNTTPRADNTLKYLTPGYGNLQAAISYSFSADLAQNTDGLKTDGFHGYTDRVLSAVGQYKSPTWQLIAYYQATWLGDKTSSAGTHQDVSPREYGLGGNAKLGFVTLHGGIAQHKDAYINGAPAGNSGQAATFKGGIVNGYSLGVSADVGTGRVLAQIQVSDPNSSVRKNNQSAHTQRIYSLGYTYPFSKRTNVYAYASYLDGAWFDNVSTGVSANDWNAKQVVIGLRHLF